MNFSSHLKTKKIQELENFINAKKNNKENQFSITKSESFNEIINLDVNVLSF